MLNKEKYAKEIVEIAINNGTIALKDNKPISCSKIKCIDCEQNVPGCGCSMKKLTEWANSEYKEPVLTEEEKEYLSSVIKPFRKFVVYIEKIKYIDGWEKIIFYSQNLKSWECMTNLPPFQSGTRFKGMKLNRQYKLEELGL